MVVVGWLRSQQLDLKNSKCERVGGLPDVSSEVDAEVAADAARQGGKGLSLTEHLSSLLDNVLSFPTHANNWPRGKELA
jgi:hypothetical protein